MRRASLEQQGVVVGGVPVEPAGVMELPFEAHTHRQGRKCPVVESVGQVLSVLVLVAFMLSLQVLMVLVLVLSLQVLGS